MPFFQETTEKMKISKLILTGILGVILSVIVISSLLLFVVSPLQQQSITKYQSTELVKEFHLVYPESAMIAMSGNFFEQQISFTHSKNARWVSLTFIDGMGGQKITYICERIISSENHKRIFYFEDPTTEIIRNNVCDKND